MLIDEKWIMLKINWKLIRVWWSFSYQVLEACLRPEIAFFNLQTREVLVPTNPGSCCINTSSWRSPFKKTLLVYIYWIFHLNVRVKDIMTLMLVGLTTVEKVSWKWNPSCWWKPLATSFSLYLLIEPSGFSLTLKIHLHQIAFLWDGRKVRVQVSFFIRELYSDCIALDHSCCAKSCFVVVGSKCIKKAFSLVFLNFGSC